MMFRIPHLINFSSRYRLWWFLEKQCAYEFFAKETHETVWTKLWAERIYGIVNDFLNDFVTECSCDHVRSEESCDNRFIYPSPTYIYIVTQ